MPEEKKENPDAVKKEGDMSEKDIKKQNDSEDEGVDEGEDDDESKKEEARLEALRKEHEEGLAREKERQVMIEREKIAQEEYKERKKKREEESGGGEDEKASIMDEMRIVLAEERQLLRKELLGSQIVEKARKLSSSDTEAAYIVEIHKNRTWPAYLTLDEQLEEAFAIANRRRLIAQNEELKRSLKSKDTKKTDTSGTHRDQPAAGEPKLDAQDINAIKQAGFVWDGVKRLYKKQIAGGKKTLYFDAKTKKRWVE